MPAELADFRQQASGKGFASTQCLGNRVHNFPAYLGVARQHPPQVMQNVPYPLVLYVQQINPAADEVGFAV